MNDEWHYRGYTMKQLDEMIARDKEAFLDPRFHTPGWAEKRLKEIRHERARMETMTEHYTCTCGATSPDTCICNITDLEN